jgi:MFS family permease
MEGARTVWRDRRLRALTGLGMTLNLSTAPLGVLLVALTIDQLGGGGGTLGVLQALLAAGMFAGSIAAGVLARRHRSLMLALVGAGACVVWIGASGVTALAGAGMVGLGLAMAVANTGLITTYQRLVPADQQGRVFGIVGAAIQALRPIGLAVAAPLIAGVGITGSYVACGVVLVVATVVWAPAAGLWRIRSAGDGAGLLGDEPAQAAQRPLVAHEQHH